MYPAYGYLLAAELGLEVDEAEDADDGYQQGNQCCGGDQAVEVVLFLVEPSDAFIHEVQAHGGGIECGVQLGAFLPDELEGLLDVAGQDFGVADGQGPPWFGTEVVEYYGGHAVLQGLEVEVLDYADYLGGHVITLMPGEFQTETEKGVFGHEGLVDDKCAVGVQVVRLGEVAAFCYFHPEERDEVGVYGEAVHLHSLTLIRASPAHLALGYHLSSGKCDIGDVGILQEHLPEGLAAVSYLVAYEELHCLLPVEAHVVALHVLDLHCDEQRAEYQDEGDDVLEAHEDRAHLAALGREGEGAFEDHGRIEGCAVAGGEDTGDECGDYSHA